MTVDWFSVTFSALHAGVFLFKVQSLWVVFTVILVFLLLIYETGLCQIGPPSPDHYFITWGFFLSLFSKHFLSHFPYPPRIPDWIHPSRHVGDFPGRKSTGEHIVGVCQLKEAYRQNSNAKLPLHFWKCSFKTVVKWKNVPKRVLEHKKRWGNGYYLKQLWN